MTTLQSERLEYGQQPLANSAPRWTTSLVVIALLLALAGIGVGAFALARQPTKVSGPTGPQGVPGARGPQGRRGAIGTLASSSIVRGTPQVSAPNPDPGTVVVATTSCPSGSVLLSGGAQVSAPGATADRNVVLRSSLPLNDTTWETVGLVTGSLGQGTSMTITPYAVCGVPATSTATSISTTTTLAP
jgi:hypothetical protein